MQLFTKMTRMLLYRLHCFSIDFITKQRYVAYKNFYSLAPHESIGSVFKMGYNFLSRLKLSTDITANENETNELIEIQAIATETSLKTANVFPGRGPPPDKPVNCCMTGCANCVWITYAAELVHYYRPEGKQKVREAIQNIDDPNLRGFLEIELAQQLQEWNRLFIFKYLNVYIVLYSFVTCISSCMNILHLLQLYICKYTLYLRNLSCLMFHI